MGWQRVPCVWMVGLAACGFNARAVDDDAISRPPPPADAALDALASLDAEVIDAPVDAALDAPIDAAPPTGCFVHWFAGDLSISAPAELVTMSTSASERDPWIAADDLTLYFVRDQGAGGDVVRATRLSTADAFRSDTRVAEINSNVSEGRASLTADGLLLALSSNRGPPGSKFEIHLARRTSASAKFDPPSTLHLDMVNGDAADHHDAFLSADGTRIYLAPVLGRQHIVVATRPDTASDFAPPVDVMGISEGASPDADPALSPDERVLVFSSRRPDGGDSDLWYATRLSADTSFGPAKRIPVVSSGMDDGDPVLSSDGCTLYFSSRRNGGDYDLFAARIAL